MSESNHDESRERHSMVACGRFHETARHGTDEPVHTDVPATPLILDFFEYGARR